MKLLDYIALPHNWLSDRDFIWWPFSFLRPQRSELISHRHTLLMTGCFGGLTFVMFTVFAVMNGAWTLESGFLTFLSCFLGFYGWFNLVTRPLWNYRARSLRR